MRDPLNTVNLYSPRVAEEYMKSKKVKRVSSRLRRSRESISNSSRMLRKKTDDRLPYVRLSNNGQWESRNLADARSDVSIRVPEHASSPEL
jgi:hypothetical protein